MKLIPILYYIFSLTYETIIDPVIAEKVESRLKDQIAQKEKEIFELKAQIAGLEEKHRCEISALEEKAYQESIEAQNKSLSNMKQRESDEEKIKELQVDLRKSLSNSKLDRFVNN